MTMSVPRRTRGCLQLGVVQGRVWCLHTWQQQQDMGPGAHAQAHGAALPSRRHMVHTDSIVGNRLSLLLVEKAGDC